MKKRTQGTLGQPGGMGWFILYFVYTAGTFFVHPYITARLGALLQFTACSFLFIIAAFNFDYKKTPKLFSYVLCAAWFVCAYGTLQIADRYIFRGIDILSWTDFFHERIFSTIANPNFLADFCVFILFSFAFHFSSFHSYL